MQVKKYFFYRLGNQRSWRGSFGGRAGRKASEDVGRIKGWQWAGTQAHTATEEVFPKKV